MDLTIPPPPPHLESRSCPWILVPARKFRIWHQGLLFGLYFAKSSKIPQPWPYDKSTINETSLGHLYLLHQQSGMELQFARPWTACPQQEIPSPYLHWLKVLLASHKRMLHTKAFCYNKDASAKVANFNSFLEQQKKKKKVQVFEVPLPIPELLTWMVFFFLCFVFLFLTTNG